MANSGTPAQTDDRVTVARGLADQLFEADLRGRQPIERTGELAIRAWQAYAARRHNRGLYSVLEQIDRCAFAERWSQLATVFTEQGPVGVLEVLARAPSLPEAAPRTPPVSAVGVFELAPVDESEQPTAPELDAELTIDRATGEECGR